MTQEERLAEAKLTEEANIASLTKIVQYEEEKKANQKLLAARRRATGPLIRFVSSSRARYPVALESGEWQKETSTVAPAENQTTGPLNLLHPMDQLVGSNDTKQENETQTQGRSSELRIPIAEPSYSQYIAFENFTDAGTSNSDNARELLLGNAEKHATRQYPAKPLCMLSGRAARYRDPETGIYYGNQRAYTMLQEVKTGSVPWNQQLRLYVPKP